MHRCMHSPLPQPGEDVDAADDLAEQQEGAAVALAAAAQVAAVVLDVDAAGAPEALQRAAGQLHDYGLLVGSRETTCNPTLILLSFHAEAAQGTLPYHDAILVHLGRTSRRVPTHTLE